MVKISVVAPVYNVPIPILKEAVESVLNQTFRDFEFIIVDDGASEECGNYLESLTDERVRIIHNLENLGTTKSLNIGFRAAQGKYIARMDADDVCMPERFQRQFDFMERHPNAIVCGTRVEMIGDCSGTSGELIPDMETYRIRAVFRNPGPFHPTAFFNRELLLRYDLAYDESLVCSQDYGLYVEIAKHGDVFVLPEPSLYRRFHSCQTTRTRRETQIRCDQATQKKLLCELLGDVSDEELDLHYRYSTRYYPDATINEDVLKWYRRLMKANNRVRIYDRGKFNRFIYENVVKQAIEASISPSMTLLQKTALFFRSLPFPMALKETTAIGARKIARSLRR